MESLPTDGVVVEWEMEPDGGPTVLIEGLPGVGHVGKLSVDHLLDERSSSVLCRVYSEHFPPQVAVDSEGIGSLPVCTFHVVQTDAEPILLLTGDQQAVTSIGYYRLTNTFLDIAEEVGIERIFAIGGMPVGELVDERSVVGATSSDTLQPVLERAGVEFRDEAPEGGIVGVTGLLLGLGKHRELTVSCLLGETSGYLVDPKSATAILEIIETTLGLSIEYDRLESRAESMEEVIRKVQEMQQQDQPGLATDDDLRYIE